MKLKILSIIFTAVFMLSVTAHAATSGSYKVENQVPQEFLIAAPDFAPFLEQAKIYVQVADYMEGKPVKAQITARYVLKNKDSEPIDGEIYFSESFLNHSSASVKLNGVEATTQKLSFNTNEAMDSLFGQGKYREYFNNLAEAVKSSANQGERNLNVLNIDIEATDEAVLEISYERELTHFVQRDKEGMIEDEFHEWNYVYSALETFSDFDMLEIEILYPTEFYIANMVAPELSSPGRAVYKLGNDKFEGELLMFQLMPNANGEGTIFSVLITFAVLATIFLGLRAMYTIYVRNRPNFARKDDD